MILLLVIATLTGAAVFVAYLLEFALTTRRDSLSADTGNAARRRARRAAGMYVRRSEAAGVPRVPDSVDADRAPAA
jgi:hypothetical protein